MMAQKMDPQFLLVLEQESMMTVQTTKIQELVLKPWAPIHQVLIMLLLVTDLFLIIPLEVLMLPMVFIPCFQMCPELGTQPVVIGLYTVTLSVQIMWVLVIKLYSIIFRETTMWQ